jgi:hypothetical protein
MVVIRGSCVARRVLWPVLQRHRLFGRTPKSLTVSCTLTVSSMGMPFAETMAYPSRLRELV